MVKALYSLWKTCVLYGKKTVFVMVRMFQLVFAMAIFEKIIVFAMVTYCVLYSTTVFFMVMQFLMCSLW